MTTSTKSTAIQLQPRAPVKNIATLRQLVISEWKTITAAMVEVQNPDRMGALLMMAVRKTPKLLDCTQESVLAALMDAAKLGLEINSSTGEAYLIPYGTEATLVPGYKGLVKLALRSRIVKAIEARLVYADDVFACEYGTNPHIKHVPALQSENRGAENVLHAYAVAKMPDGETTFDVMTFDELEAIRKRSKGAARTDSPWNTDREEMQRKTVTRRLCKYLPLTPELATAVELADRHDTGEVGHVEPESVPQATASLARETARKTEGLRQRLGAGSSQSVAEEPRPQE